MSNSFIAHKAIGRHYNTIEMVKERLMEIENKSIIEKRKATMQNSIKQLAVLEETEVHICIDFQEKKLKIYTNKATIMNRLERLGYKYIKQDTVNGQVYSRSYEFPTSDIGKFLRTGIFKYD